jgi:hypothetical protein
MRFDPGKLAVQYYFGDLQYWKLPKLACDALEAGWDGPALRRLAGLATTRDGSEIRADDLRTDEIDSAFREMGVNAPISKDEARLILAIESASRAMDGSSNIFDEATHVRIHLCWFSDPPDLLSRIVKLSEEAKHAPRSQWARIEADLKNAFADLLMFKKVHRSE